MVRLFAECEARLGPLCGLVNNAGVITAYGRVDALSGEALHRNFAVNTVAYFLCAREAVRRMSTRHGGSGGVIVNVSSRAATMGMPGEYVHYAASKAAVNALTTGLGAGGGGRGYSRRVRQPRPDRHRNPDAGSLRPPFSDDTHATRRHSRRRLPRRSSGSCRTRRPT